MRRCTRVVEGGKDARRALLFDEVADDLVVEVLDRGPLDLLAHVLFLLGLERELDEDFWRAPDTLDGLRTLAG